MSTELNRALHLSNAMKEAARTIASAVVATQTTCINCTHFDEKNELCKLAGKRPPARTIAFGCEAFTDEIPF